MSLCCLLIETIECYRLGWPSSHWKELCCAAKGITSIPEPDYEIQKPIDHNHYSSKIVFERFFEESKRIAFFPEMKGKGKDFYESIRCGLLHQAQTKDSWRITTSGKSWDDATDVKTINRNKFADNLKSCFDAFLGELESREWDEEPWKSARKKIWWLVQTS